MTLLMMKSGDSEEPDHSRNSPKDLCTDVKRIL